MTMQTNLILIRIEAESLQIQYNNEIQALHWLWINQCVIFLFLRVSHGKVFFLFARSAKLFSRNPYFSLLFHWLAKSSKRPRFFTGPKCVNFD